MSKPTEPASSQNAPFNKLEAMGGELTKVFGDAPPEKKRTSWLHGRNQTRLMWAALILLLTLVLVSLPTALTSLAVNTLP